MNLQSWLDSLWDFPFLDSVLSAIFAYMLGWFLGWKKRRIDNFNRVLKNFETAKACVTAIQSRQKIVIGDEALHLLARQEYGNLCRSEENEIENEIVKLSAQIFENPRLRLSAIRRGKNLEVESRRLAKEKIQEAFVQTPVDIKRLKIPPQLIAYEDMFLQVLRALENLKTNERRRHAEDFKIKLTQADLFWIFVFFMKESDSSALRKRIQELDLLRSLNFDALLIPDSARLKFAALHEGMSIPARARDLDTHSESKNQSLSPP